MDEAELVGGVLVDASDPRVAARALAQLILAPTNRTSAKAAGLHPDLVDVLRARFGNDPAHVAVVCQEGAAWVLGRRSIAAGDSSYLVASLPGGTHLPTGLRHTTAETLVQLVVQATQTLRLAAPF